MWHFLKDPLFQKRMTQVVILTMVTIGCLWQVGVSQIVTILRYPVLNRLKQQEISGVYFRYSEVTSVQVAVDTKFPAPSVTVCMRYADMMQEFYSRWTSFKTEKDMNEYLFAMMQKLTLG